MDGRERRIKVGAGDDIIIQTIQVNIPKRDFSYTYNHR